jgi:hypothetical protein
MTLDTPIDFGTERSSFHKRVMSYRVEIDGCSITMDNVREVFELIKEAKKNGSPNVVMAASEEPAKMQEWTPAVVESFGDLIRRHGLQMKVTTVLLRAPEWVTKSDLMKSLNLQDGQQLGGSLSGLSKNAAKLGVPPVFEMERVQIGGARTSRYRLTKDFRAALTDLIEHRRRQAEQEMYERNHPGDEGDHEDDVSDMSDRT